ncbi:MAG: hypothetical protein AAFN27_16400 [Pseudomonadota bacterium]
MSSDDQDQRMSGASDRRFLPRSEPGRRSEDVKTKDILPDLDVEDAVPRSTPVSYLFILFATLMIGVVGVRSLNSYFAPLLYDDRHVWSVGETLSEGRSYLTYDLNIETRGLRRESIRNLPTRPEFVVMGASHWQEAHGAIAPGVDFYNAHVHRDYYEDIVAVASWFYQFDKMPEKLMISIRDNQFAPVEDRTDFLWVPILPDYRQAAPIFGLEAHQAYANGLTPRMRQAVSLPLLWDNVERFLNSPVLPQVSSEFRHDTLDVLLPDGGIYWSEKHRRKFTDERTYRESIALAEAKIASPPTIDPAGLEALDRVLAFMIDHGVEVSLTHPPFNPIVWDHVEGTRYISALKRIEDAVQSIADAHGIPVVGSFNPYDVGCTNDMYIDGEHSSPLCLAEIIAEALHPEVPRLASIETGATQ